MSWFKDLIGSNADDPVSVRDNITVDGTVLTSNITGRVMNAGTLTTPSLGELRQAIPNLGPLHVRESVGDVQALHLDPANAGALFQVASQFNLLEMVSPDVAPEDGIARYAHDHTQGPACAMACGAGTLWRNYFAPAGSNRSGVGQNSWYQYDMLSDLGSAVGNDAEQLWEMRNGYVLTHAAALEEIGQIIQAADVDHLRTLLRIGVQSDTEVTLNNCQHRVTQTYNSALPIAYKTLPAKRWEPFARLVLEATYEATMHAAIQNANRTGNRKVYLTLLGGRAFGNSTGWIIDAMRRAFILFASAGLDVNIVSYNSPNPHLASVLTENTP